VRRRAPRQAQTVRQPPGRRLRSPVRTSGAGSGLDSERPEAPFSLSLRRAARSERDIVLDVSSLVHDTVDLLHSLWMARSLQLCPHRAIGCSHIPLVLHFLFALLLRCCGRMQYAGAWCALLQRAGSGWLPHPPPRQVSTARDGQRRSFKRLSEK
jgi:hypothetical protein